jgi:AraC-like DNA-binding protein
MNYKYFLIVVILNGLILIAALLSRKENRQANRLLSILLAVALFSQCVLFLQVTGEIEDYALLLQAKFPARLMIPSLFYLYILALTVPGYRWVKRYWNHFLPFVFGLAACVFLSIFSGRVVDWRENSSFLMERYIFMLISMGVTAFYFILSLRQLQRFQNIIPYFFSDLIRVRLLWLKVLFILFLVPWGVEWVDVFTGPFIIVVEWIMIPIVMIIILLIGFFGLRQSVIFSQEADWRLDPEVSEAMREMPLIQKKEIKSVSFPPEELSKWKVRLEKYMEEKKPFLELEYHLTDLSGALSLKPYQLSEILNQGVGVPFFDFINHYRVEEAKRRLRDPAFDHMKILAIAMDCGFNSKSSFNDTFRKMTGVTPSQYRSASAAASPPVD